MFIRVHPIVICWLVSATLCVASSGLAFADSTVLPLLSLPGDSAYCRAALEAVGEATESLSVLLSSVSVQNNPLLPALAGAAARGVRVRVLLDASDWASEITDKHRAVQAYLSEHGIEARWDDPSVTLHAKLLVADGATVLLGSSNWNSYALTEHRQADVSIREPSIAAFYQEYFDLLWEEDWDGCRLRLDTPADLGEMPTLLPLADLPGSAGYARVLLGLLRGAARSVHIALYRMSYYSGYGDSLANDLIEALIDAAHRGLTVQVLLDDCAYYADSADANLAAAVRLRERGIQVRFDGAEETTHCKLVIIDQETVLLGSTNWNYYSLEHNFEVNLALLNLPAAARSFDGYFQLLWGEGRELDGR